MIRANKQITVERFREKKLPWNPQKLKDVHQEIARLSLIGMKKKQIAETVGMTPEAVGMILKSPLVKRHSSLLAAEADKGIIDVKKKIVSLLPKALECLERTLENENGTITPELQSKNSLELLKLAIPREARLELSGNIAHNHLTASDLEDIRNRKDAAKIAMRELGVLVSEEYDPGSEMVEIELVKEDPVDPVERGYL